MRNIPLSLSNFLGTLSEKKTFLCVVNSKMADPAPLKRVFRLELVLRQSPVCGWIYCCFLPPDHCIGDIHSSCLSKTILHISISTSGSVRSKVFHAWGGFELQSPRQRLPSYHLPARVHASLNTFTHFVFQRKSRTRWKHFNLLAKHQRRNP